MIKPLQACSFALSIIAASTSGAAGAEESLIQHLNNHLEGSLGAEHLSYSEINENVTPQLPQGADLDTETGTMVAAGFSAEWQGRLGGIDKLRAGVDLHIAAGNGTYNGYEQDLQSGDLSPLSATTNETFVDFQLKAGKGFVLIAGRDQLTPYVGIGLTAWNRDLSSAPGGYTEDYRNGFWKIGVQYQYELMRNLVANLDAGYGQTFSATMTASIDSPTFDLGNTTTQRYSAGLRYALARKSYIGIDAYWMRYGYNESPAYTISETEYVLEPTSHTTRDGIVLVGGFAYR